MQQQRARRLLEGGREGWRMAVRKAGAGEAWGAWAQACSSEIEPVGVLEACMKSPMNLTASSRIDRSLRARSSRCELPAELPATAPPFSWDDTAGGASASRGEAERELATRERGRRRDAAARRAGARERGGQGAPSHCCRPPRAAQPAAWRPEPPTQPQASRRTREGASCRTRCTVPTRPSRPLRATRAR